MTTCRDLIGRALRKINALPSGENIPPDQANDCLAALQGLYTELVGMGAFGRLNDITITATTYTAREQDRIRTNNAAGVAVTLPDLITTSDFPCTVGALGDWGSILPPNGAWDYGASYSITPRAPLDGACVVITDQLSDFHETYVYESAFANWTKIDGLGFNDEAPFSKLYSEGLAALLAERMADDFGAQVTQTLARTSASFRYSLIHRYQSAMRNIAVPYL